MYFNEKEGNTSFFVYIDLIKNYLRGEINDEIKNNTSQFIIN